jgi:hypothetical protein
MEWNFPSRFPGRLRQFGQRRQVPLPTRPLAAGSLDTFSGLAVGLMPISAAGRIRRTADLKVLHAVEQPEQL